MPRWISLWPAAACFVASLAVSVNTAYAVCSGCSQHADAETAICTSECNAEGLRLTVFKATPGPNGNLEAPSGCNVASGNAQYLVLEGIPKQRMYSQSHYSLIPHNNNFIQTNVQIIHQSASGSRKYCEADSSQSLISGNVYLVTFQSPQGNLECIPALAETSDCGDFNQMAAHFLARQHTYGYGVTIPHCWEGCAEYEAPEVGGEDPNSDLYDESIKSHLEHLGAPGSPTPDWGGGGMTTKKTTGSAKAVKKVPDAKAKSSSPAK